MNQQLILNFSTLSKGALDRYAESARGLYLADFTTATAEQLDRASKDFTADALNVFIGRKWVFHTFYDSNDIIRAAPIPETVPADAPETLKKGSFNFSALNCACLVRAYNAATRSACRCGRLYFCTSCYRFMCDPAHDCSAPSCLLCGGVLPVKDVRAGRDRCTECEKSARAQIHDYHRRPVGQPTFEKPNDRRATPHLGLEVEVGSDGRELDETFTRPLSDLVNPLNAPQWLYFEHDSSLCGGVECIPEPTTLNGLKARKKALTEFYATATANGGAFGRVNGLHCHIDKEFFTIDGDTDTPARPSVLIEYFIAKYYNFFTYISHRKKDAFYYTTKKDIKTVFDAVAKSTEQSHFYAVNTSTSTGHTVEIRIFGGKIDTYARFIAVADICSAIAKWAKKATLTTAESATPASIAKYITDPKNIINFVTEIPSLWGDNAPAKDSETERHLTAFVNALREKIAKREAVK